VCLRSNECSRRLERATCSMIPPIPQPEIRTISSRRMPNAYHPTLAQRLWTWYTFLLTERDRGCPIHPRSYVRHKKRPWARARPRSNSSDLCQGKMGTHLQLRPALPSLERRRAKKDRSNIWFFILTHFLSKDMLIIPRFSPNVKHTQRADSTAISQRVRGMAPRYPLFPCLVDSAE